MYVLKQNLTTEPTVAKLRLTRHFVRHFCTTFHKNGQNGFTAGGRSLHVRPFFIFVSSA